MTEKQLIVVDNKDKKIKLEAKSICHQGLGIRHRAYSVFLFNHDGYVLLQQRSDLKPLWPGFWANACCSHPEEGVNLKEHVINRIEEELGIIKDDIVNLSYAFHFEYHAKYKNIGSEHEICHVFLGTTGVEPKLDPSEVKAFKWIHPLELDRIVKNRGFELTPWLKMEWQRLRSKKQHILNTYIADHSF